MLYIYRNKKNPLSLFAEIVVCILLLLFISIRFFGLNININILSFLVLLNSIAMIVLVFTNKTIYHSGALMMFFLYNLLVNNGFVIAMFIKDDYATFQSVTSMAFLYNDYYIEAILIANIVLSFFSLTLLYSRKNSLDFKDVTVNNDDIGSSTANIIGLSLISFATLFTAYLLFSNGLWFNGYQSTINALENTDFQHIVIIASLGIAFLISDGTKEYVHLGMIIFGLYSVLQFAMGNRGEVFYAAVICFALYSLRFKSISYKHIIFAGIAVILLIPLIRISRELKVDEYTLNPFVSFLDVLAEEGIEISPFTYIVQYVNTKSGYVWGMTYISDFTDFIFRRIGSSNPFSIERYVIKEIMPYNGMAFSMIAEMYYNFTVVGASALFAIIGQCIRNFDKKIYANELKGVSRIGGSMILVELINLTRNDASTLPVYLTYAFLIICLYKILNPLLKRNA